jgi:hypothetical protein
MREKNKLSTLNNGLSPSEHERGMGLIVVIMVLAFLQVIGFTLLMVTGTGSKVAANVRTQQQSHNAAESGFDMARVQIEEFFSNGEWSSFEGQYLTEPAGIDDPQSDDYFRNLTDTEIIDLIDPDKDGIPDLNTVIFCRQPYIKTIFGGLNPNYTYTVFLIDDEAGAGASNHADTLVVCIGCAGTSKNRTTTRLEVEIALQLQ